MNKVLFILKRKENFNATVDTHIGLTTGLYNSASFVDEMLVSSGVKSNMVVVADNNDIDREVTRHHPTHVIIEALWVVPEKFAVLCRLHPNVKWIIRIHSEMPFMAGEGMAMDWLGEYVKFKNILIGVNAPRMFNETKFYLQHMMNWTDEQAQEKIIYMPNYYPTDFLTKPYNINKDHIDISCFGAVRPLKNHMLQAFAALKFADKINKKLHFHINSGRLEMKGEPVLHNLRGLFQHLYDKGHRLISHEWTHRDDFLTLCAQMDIGMQCSFSETFNIVGADLISQGVPLLGSNEIPWSDPTYNADPTSSEDMFNKLMLIHEQADNNVRLNHKELHKYVNTTRDIWSEYFKGQR